MSKQEKNHFICFPVKSSEKIMNPNPKFKTQKIYLKFVINQTITQYLDVIITYDVVSVVRDIKFYNFASIWLSKGNQYEMRKHQKIN